MSEEVGKSARWTVEGIFCSYDDFDDLAWGLLDKTKHAAALEEYARYLELFNKHSRDRTREEQADVRRLGRKFRMCDDLLKAYLEKIEWPFVHGKRYRVTVEEVPA